MSFSIRNTTVSGNNVATESKDPIFNVNKLQNTPISFSNLLSNDILLFNGLNWINSQLNIITGPSGPSGGETGPTGANVEKTGPIGYTNTLIITGPTGTNHLFFGSTGNIGDININSITGPANFILGVTGPTGLNTATSTNTGPTGYMITLTGPLGHIGIDHIGVGTITGPSGYVGGGSNTNEHTGATGPNGFIPNDPLASVININSQNIINNTNTTLTSLSQTSLSSIYLPVSNDTIGVNFGLWKVIINLDWDVGTGYRKISIVNAENDSIVFAANSTESVSGINTKQQLVYIGNFNNTDTTGNNLKIKVEHDNPSSLNVKGVVSIFSYTTIIPSIPTGPDGPNPIGNHEFAIRLINHDMGHEPKYIGVFAANNIPATVGTYYTTPVVNGKLTRIPTPYEQTGVTNLLIPWSSLPPVDGNPQVREFILGGENELLVSAHVYIIKTENTVTNNLIPTWTVQNGDNVGGIPQNYLNTLSASDLTADYIEFTFNKPSGQYALFINQTLVDGFNIPMTLTIFFRDTGNRRIPNGPVGLNKSMNTIFNEYKPQATGGSNPFFRTLKPNYTNPARFVTPQKLDSSEFPAFDNYMNDYLNEFWTKWNGMSNKVTFYPGGPTGPNSEYTHVELYTSGSFYASPSKDMGSGTMTVTPLGAQSQSGTDQFTLDVSDLYGKTIDLIGASGVWITGTKIQQSVKALLAASIVRGVAHLSATLFPSESYQSNVSFQQSYWNGYHNKGKGFYLNQNPNVYGKVLHDLAIQNSSIDALSLPFAYAISYDDVYNYSSSIGSSQIGTIPSNITQVYRVNVDIYENDNY